MSEELLRKATEMRNAIDMIEGAVMGLGDFVDLPDLFEGTAEHVNLAPPMTVGEMRRVCTALAECTRIINSDEFAPDELRRHAQCAPTADELRAVIKGELEWCKTAGKSLTAEYTINKVTAAVLSTLTSTHGGSKGWVWCATCSDRVDAEMVEGCRHVECPKQQPCGVKP